MERIDSRAQRPPEPTASGAGAARPEPASRRPQAPPEQAIEPLSAPGCQPLAPQGAGPELELQIRAEPFRPLEVLDRWHQRLAQQAQGVPAAESQFIGRVRGVDAGGQPLQALELEHYPGMTEAQITALARVSMNRHGASAVLVWHRVGLVLPGDTIVLVAVAADRRGPAQRCGQELLEALKHEAPFWKREWSGGRGTWVQGNTPL